MQTRPLASRRASTSLGGMWCGGRMIGQLYSLTIVMKRFHVYREMFRGIVRDWDCLVIPMLMHIRLHIHSRVIFVSIIITSSIYHCITHSPLRRHPN
jgi:hypothetical protein